LRIRFGRRILTLPVRGASPRRAGGGPDGSP
jgi:hypothetical protein